MVAFKMGRRQGGPSRTSAKGAYLNRYVTDEQRSRRPIFNAILRAAAICQLLMRRCTSRFECLDRKHRKCRDLLRTLNSRHRYRDRAALC
jgi:hypothetical protein